jgi:hypothetical protein
MLALCATLAFLLVLAYAGPARAEGSSWWRLNSTSAPTLLPTGANGEEGEGQLLVTATNLGDGEVSGSKEPVTLSDVLPAGVTPVEVSTRGFGTVTGAGTCSIRSTSSQEVRCTFEGKVAPYESLGARIIVHIKEPAEGPQFKNVVSVEGGETHPPQPLEAPLKLAKVEKEPTPFGVQAYALTPENAGGSPATQAGSHPFQLTTLLDFNQTLERYGPGNGDGIYPSAPALPRNLHFELPPGLVGDPSAVPQCSIVDFTTVTKFGNLCSQDTAVGVVAVQLYDPKVVTLDDTDIPVFDLEPGPGEPARFGFVVTTGANVPVVLRTAVPSGGDYAVEVSVENAPQTVQLLSSVVTLWGVPGDPRHNASRGWGCLKHNPEAPPCEQFTEASPKAFLTLPTACEAAETSVRGESWSAPPYVFEQKFGPIEPSAPFPTMTGCPLAFDPSLGIEPETHSASTPTGLNATVEMGQFGLLAPEETAESAVQDTTVTLPPGVQVNPSSANGLQACSLTAIGYKGTSEKSGILEFAPEEARQLSSEEQEQLEREGRRCPQASKLGTVEIETPLLSEKLSGSVYLAQPAPNGEAGKNPFNSLVALYIVAENPKLGILVKLAGEGRLNEETGQVTTRFDGTPQLPFHKLRLHFFGREHEGAGEEREALSTPAFCGDEYRASSQFTGFSQAFSAPLSEPPFQVTSGPNGGVCPSGTLPFDPSFQAGAANQQAGALTPFTVTIGQADGAQPLERILLHLPSGIAALISQVPPCPEANVLADTCGEASLVGHTTAVAGLGGEPVTLGGRVYLTGELRPTAGHPRAPLGLLAVTHAAAGPFDLGEVPVLSTIEVDPNTAAVTVQSEPIPKLIDGVPAQLKQVQVTVERPGNQPFEFNPTNCDARSVTGSLTGYEGGLQPLSYPFQVTGCATLPFAPKLTASAGGHGSKADGTSLDVKVASSGVGQANIAKVDLQLPKALPSRLSTLQKACPDSVFEANPASCDEGSVIGEATVHTPVLKSPLTGPGYLVSHGGAAFPDVEFVLQGEGITVVLDGKTDIKDGITYSKFESAPDVPFTTFETELPTGPHSAFTANVAENEDFSLCKTSLSMPTTITGQNGAVIEQDTKIAVTGCGGVKSYRASKAELLAKAIKACKKDKKKSKRVACEKAARKKYETKKASNKNASKTSKKQAKKK